MERKAPVPPQRSAPQLTLGMLVQTTPLQQSTSLQPVLTPTKTVTDLVGGPHDLLKTFQKILQTT
jgi:hypothetical protein